jgi:hypothetical protein
MNTSHDVSIMILPKNLPNGLSVGFNYPTQNLKNHPFLESVAQVDILQLALKAIPYLYEDALAGPMHLCSCGDATHSERVGEVGFVKNWYVQKRTYPTGYLSTSAREGREAP